jgi:hypothetical protein
MAIIPKSNFYRINLKKTDMNLGNAPCIGNRFGTNKKAAEPSPAFYFEN